MSIKETDLHTPGVYITEVSTFPPSVVQVSTAIPAFIGYTQTAVDAAGQSLTNVPTKISSFREYEKMYGLAENETGIAVAIDITTDAATNAVVAMTGNATIRNPSVNNMYYAIRHYFDNGGGVCYILSIGRAKGVLNPDFFLGVNKNAGGGLAALAAYGEPTLLLFPEGQGLTEGDYYALINQAFEQCKVLKDRFVIVDVHTVLPNEQKPDTTQTIAQFRTAFARISDLNYGAAYYPNLRTTYNYRYRTADVQVTIRTNGALAGAVTLKTLKQTQTAVYHLSIEKIKAQLRVLLPPSPAIAGVYAKVDGSGGVWKAPANIPLNAVEDLTDLITEAEQENMNVDPGSGKSVNAIRMFTGKGRLVWGARTLDGNSSEWRYISIRRLFITVEESAKIATIPFVFEPNDATTWVKIRAMLENYMIWLWRQGALAGAKSEHAFFVKCGLGQTMTDQDILEGRLIVEIGMAAVRPAEFVILRFMHKVQES